MERWHNPQHSFKLQYKTRSYALTWYGNLIEFIGFFESFLHYCSKISFSKWVSYNFILCHKSASENTFLTSRNFNYVVRCNFWTFFLGAYGINFSTDNEAVKCIFCKRCVIFYAIEKLRKREHKVTSKSKITLSQVCVKSHWERMLTIHLDNIQFLSALWSGSTFAFIPIGAPQDFPGHSTRTKSPYIHRVCDQSYRLKILNIWRIADTLLSLYWWQSRSSNLTKLDFRLSCFISLILFEMSAINEVEQIPTEEFVSFSVNSNSGSSSLGPASTTKR